MDQFEKFRISKHKLDLQLTDFGNNIVCEVPEAIVAAVTERREI